MSAAVVWNAGNPQITRVECEEHELLVSIPHTENARADFRRAERLARKHNTEEHQPPHPTVEREHIPSALAE